MAKEHWITKRLGCSADRAFTTLSTEVVKAMACWASAGGVPAFQAVTNVDNGYNRIEVHEGGRLRAYIAHRPGNDVLTATCGRVNFIGQYDEIKHWCLVTKWDEANQECQMLVAIDLTTPMTEVTATAFVQMLLEPVLFPTPEAT